MAQRETALRRRALKSALLAISADKLGNNFGAEAAGYVAGQLIHDAALDLESVWADLIPEGIVDAQIAWHGIVDGWYDAGEGF